MEEGLIFGILHNFFYLHTEREKKSEVNKLADSLRKQPTFCDVTTGFPAK